MELSTVGIALDLITKASKGLDAVRERAKTASDVGLKENISKLYDDFLDLKAIVLRLTEENLQLRQAIAAQADKPPTPEAREVGSTVYYFLGDQGPYCQRCYDQNDKLVRVTARQKYVGGWGRKCEVCDTVFYE
jgi:hypothetical protein